MVTATIHQYFYSRCSSAYSGHVQVIFPPKQTCIKTCLVRLSRNSSSPLRTVRSAGGRSRWVASCPPGFEPRARLVSHRGFLQFLPLQVLQLLPHAWMCHNGQGDVPVTFEVWLASDTSQPRAVSSYRGRSSLRTRAWVGECVRVVVWVSAWVQILQLVWKSWGIKKKLLLEFLLALPLLLEFCSIPMARSINARPLFLPTPSRLRRLESSLS